MKADTIAMAVKTKSISDFKSLMSLSSDLATRTYSEFQEYVNYDELMSIQKEDDTQSINSKIYPAGLLFDGPAYKALSCETLTENEVEIGITCIRFLSGLYGLLKMNDNIQRHRLEMSTKISIENNKNLYTYWSQYITEQINIEKNNIIQSSSSTSSSSFTASTPFILLNIASEEYFKAISIPHLDTDIKVIDCIFLDKGKVVSVYAKRARGLLARYICTSVMMPLSSDSDDTTGNTSLLQPSPLHQQPIAIITRLKAFNSEGYTYDENKSKILPNCERSVLVYNRSDVRKKGGSSKNQRDSITATTGEDDANSNTSSNNIVNIEPKTKRGRKG